jgi:uncharacterized protein (DUF433 family)
MDYSHLITIEAGKRSGQPCIRGMRITVRDVLEYLAGGMTVPELLADFPELTPDDVRACLAYAVRLLPMVPCPMDGSRKIMQNINASQKSME